MTVAPARRLPAPVWAVGGRSTGGPRRVAAADLAVRRTALLALITSGAVAGHLPIAAVLVAGAVCGAASPGTYAATRWAIPRLVGPPRLGPANTVIGLSEQLPLLAAGVLFGPSFALLGSVYAVVGPSFALLGPVYAVVVPAALLLGALPVVRWLPATGARLARDRPGRVNAAGAALWGVRMLPLLVVDSPAVAAGLFLVSGAT